MTYFNLSGKITKHCSESCPSGLRSWSWKPVIPKGTVGSNPTFSARKMVNERLLPEHGIEYDIMSATGEIPKRLKGLPWKGSRSLIAARGFKSLFLRSFLRQMFRNEKSWKKVLTVRHFGVILWKLSKRSESLESFEKQDFQNNSKKCLTNTIECDKLVKLLR